MRAPIVLVAVVLLGAAACVERKEPPAAEEPGKRPCPQPSPEVICTMEYKPVVCDGCRYSNACVAGAAGFVKEQCAPAPEE